MTDDKSPEAPAARRPRRESKAQLERELTLVKLELADAKADAALLQEQAEQERDRLLRLRADFENYRKRVLREKVEMAGQAKADLVARILPALDNLERAREAAERDGSPALAEGVNMVAEQLLAALAEEGVEPIEALGRPFDPYQHEAAGTMLTPDIPEGYVVREELKGYKLGERVVRPARVVTSRAPPEERDESSVPA
ncbi:MAG: nucleotide exchange factor GrpE [Dehalococcoidia bacterium]|nr:nucleotide exchange factor GrpE [Dehalococcoidia bacterium]